MNIDIEKYKDVLQKQISKGKLSEKTGSAYISCMERMAEYFLRYPDSDVYTAIKYLGKSTEQIPKIIAAVKKYERDVLDSPKALLYGAALQELRQSYKQREIGRPLSMKESTYTHKINAIRNRKLKIALRLQYKSGLRIFEIAALEPENIILDENKKITLLIRSGKGDKARVVNVMEDSYLYDNLKIALQETETGPLFYSASYLKKKAAEYGLPTHDLRRLNSKERFRKELEAGNDRRQARREVQHQLGHEKAITTNAYLGTDWEND